VIRLYQLALSPLLPHACRFYPSCSEYSRRVIEERGIREGVPLALRRLGRCVPLRQGGLDLP
jgi:putative membrane protein insertion efficiency factor